MPLFHFHLRSPGGLSRNEFGVDFSDLDKAYLEACKAIPTLAAEILADGRDPLAYTFLIADADGSTLMEVPFRETVRERRHQPSPTLVVHTALERAQHLVAELEGERVALWQNLASLGGLLSEVGLPHHGARRLT